MVERYASLLPAMAAGDLEAISRPLDLHGVNK
jgi:hypothetical protein